MKLRRGHPDDIDAMLALKRALTFDGSTAGGFLLGTDADGYRQRLDEGRVWVLLDHDRLVGLAIVLEDAAFRRSDVWERRADVVWTEDVAPFLTQRLGYYDQLGVQRGPYRRWGAALAFTAVADLMRYVDHLVTATVSEPVCNLAAVPYIQRLGGRRVGRLDEVYDPFGPLVSDLWLVENTAYTGRIDRPSGMAERWLLDIANEVLS